MNLWSEFISLSFGIRIIIIKLHSTLPSPLCRNSLTLRSRFQELADNIRPTGVCFYQWVTMFIEQLNCSCFLCLKSNSSGQPHDNNRGTRCLSYQRRYAGYHTRWLRRQYDCCVLKLMCHRIILLKWGLGNCGIEEICGGIFSWL